MSNLIVACDNLKLEIEMITNNIKLYENPFRKVIYVDSKYHNNPKELNNKLGGIIKEKERDYENIIFLYGQCGNATIDLYSDFANLIFPRVSDCLSLYLGGDEKRAQLYKHERTYFFTKSYIENENSLYYELKKLEEKYGTNKALKMYKMMMNSYEYIRLIDTKSCDLTSTIEKIKVLSHKLNLKYEIIDADLSILRKVFNEEIDKDFVLKKKGEKLLNVDFIRNLGGVEFAKN